MRNIRLEIEYDGSAYAGWQVQRRSASCVVRQACKTIQETIEKALQKILHEKVKLIASGRTDAGVSALAQVAHFHTHSGLAVTKIKSALNALLPGDIAIAKAEEVSSGFHSIRDAKSKVYRYRILNRQHRPALFSKGVYFLRFPLDIRLMRRQARFLEGRHDFKAFCASRSSARSTLRTIKKIEITRSPYFYPSPGSPKDNSLIVIDIEAEGFLYNMARNIVGNLIEAGRGKNIDMRKVLLSKERKAAGPCAPARGLCLMRVNY